MRAACLALVVGVLGVLSPAARGQTDAQAALDKARTAFANEQFAEARDLLKTAAQTDAKNPDIFLLLGKTHYQLGEVEQAMAAWRRTLQLAPAQAYAKRMLDVLQGTIRDADVRIRVVRSLLAEGLLAAAETEVAALHKQALSPQQLAELLSLEAETLVRLGKSDLALKSLRELAIRDPQQAGGARARLLSGQAMLGLDEQSVARGLELLQGVKADFADTPQAAAADLALIEFRIQQGERAVEDLSKWIAAHGQHAEIRSARRAMVSAVGVFLSEAARDEPPADDAGLSPADEAAVAAAELALPTLVQSKPALQITQQLSEHLHKRYVAKGAFKTAEAALARLAALQLPAASRLQLADSQRQLQVAAAKHELDEIGARLARDRAAVDALKTWIQDHAEHPQINDARRMLLAELLAAAKRTGAAAADSPLSEQETAAVALIGQILASSPPAGDKLAAEFLAHLKQRYAARGAYAAAIAGQQLLLKLELTPASRMAALNELADAQLQAALSRIQTDVAAGRVQPRPLPADLAAALATLDLINRDFADHPAWAKRTATAEQLLKIADTAPWPARVTQIKPLQAWTLEVVLPVAAADADAKLTAAAVASVDVIVANVQALQQPSAAPLAAQVHARLLAAIGADHSLWPATMIKQIRLEMADSARTFQERIRTGRGAQNAALDDAQKKLLGLASQLLKARPAAAAELLKEMASYLAPWSLQGHDAAVEQAYALLEQDLPPPQRRRIRLAVVKIWIDQALHRDQRLLSSGFQPLNKLDETLAKALVRCYELQTDLAENDPLVAEIRQQRQRVIDHYRQLEYFDVAAAAIQTKAEQAVGWIDTRAQLELAELHLNVALAELDRQLETFPGRENLALTPAVREAIAELQKFISDRPESPLVPQAVQLLFSVGAKYEGFEKHQVAAEVYAGIETFAADSAPLAQANPGQATTAERAAHAAATALHVTATRALQETLDGQADDADPPQQLSDEFQAAIAAYQAIVTKYPAGPLVGPAIGKIMEIALQHSKIGAWDVAAGVYAALQQQELPLRQPERLEMARALCQLGKVLPQHAQQVLAAITLWERAAPVDNPPPAVSQLAGLIGGFGGGLGGGGSEMSNLEGAGSKPDDEAGEEGAAGGKPAAAAGPALPGGALAAAPKPSTTQPGREADAPGFADLERARRQVELLAAVRQQQAARTNRIAMLRDDAIRNLANEPHADQSQQAQQTLAAPVLSEAEIQRQQQVLDDAYALFQAIRKAHPRSASAEQARDQIMTIVDHWRTIKQWQRAAELAKRYLADNPTDRLLPAVRQGIARDYLAWAAGAAEGKLTKQELLEQVAQRFESARTELAAIIAAFPDNQSLKHQAQWDIANSHLSQARVVAGISRTLARGQFVRATNELLRTAELYHDHPNIGQLPAMLWGISQELTSRSFYDEAITVWNKMTLHYPGNELAEQAALQIAETYRNQLRQPLRAAESYLELNFARGGEAGLQDAIFQIASQLKNEKRWVEALHVLETFVDSFPLHASAGQAVAMIGDVHQTNKVWEDAIEAYRRVILEYDAGPWAQQSKWAIAECTINLSRWEEAQGAYREYQRAYPKDEKVAEATRRLEVLKDLARYQRVVDEVGQRKAFDAQHQIATIVRSQLANPVKAIIEYKKVAAKWPESHLADDALFQVGMIYMELHEADKAREAFLAAAEKYPASPLADDALFQIGASYEQDAQQLAGVTRGQSILIAKDIAQKEAYVLSQTQRRVQRAKALDQITKLKQEGKQLEADNKAAFQAARNLDFDRANAAVVANWAAQQEEALTTAQLADRQDKINASLRKAVGMFRRAASVASADKADDALLRMAQIYDQRLKDSDAAMATWLEIVKQYSGTTVAEDASWKIAQYYETHEKHADAIGAYKSFLRNYRRSPKASAAQAAIAENHEHLGNWVEAMDAYTNYINNYPEGAMVKKAKEQIAWIKTYRL